MCTCRKAAPARPGAKRAGLGCAAAVLDGHGTFDDHILRKGHGSCGNGTHTTWHPPKERAPYMIPSPPNKGLRRHGFSESSWVPSAESQNCFR